MKTYRVYDRMGNAVHEVDAETVELIDGHIVFFEDYDVRKTERIMKLGLGWFVQRVGE